MNRPVKWVAELSHVRDVSLHGLADLAYWKDQLRKEGLLPAERDGKAQILIVAADLTYKGIKFRELSISALVAQEDSGNWQNAAYLVRAFNSCRFFAFCERAFFSTPYYYGDVHMSAGFPASIQLFLHGEIVFEVKMQADGLVQTREPSRWGDDGWEGPIFLPATRRGIGRQRNFFFARIKGHTLMFPFLPIRDSMTIKSPQTSDVFQALLDSNFVATEWAVRKEAKHAKSKTYQTIDDSKGAADM